MAKISIAIFAPDERLPSSATLGYAHIIISLYLYKQNITLGEEAGEGEGEREVSGDTKLVNLIYFFHITLLLGAIVLIGMKHEL